MLKGPRKLINELQKNLEDLRCDSMMGAMPSRQQELFVALEMLSSSKRWCGCSRDVPTRLGTMTKIQVFPALCIKAEEEENHQSLQDANGNVMEADDELDNHILNI